MVFLIFITFVFLKKAYLIGCIWAVYKYMLLLSFLISFFNILLENFVDNENYRLILMVYTVQLLNKYLKKSQITIQNKLSTCQNSIAITLAPLKPFFNDIDRNAPWYSHSDQPVIKSCSFFNFNWHFGGTFTRGAFVLLHRYNKGHVVSHGAVKKAL